MPFLCCLCYCVFWCPTRLDYMRIMAGAYYEAGTAYHSRTSWLTPSF
jgi:hypothetical protein